MTPRMRHVLGLSLLLSAAACFDGEELTEGLRCTQNSHCGGELECVNGLCGDPNDDTCDTDPAACSNPGSASLSAGDGSASAGEGGAVSASATMSTTASTTGATACGGQYESCYDSSCCNYGVCVNYGNGTATCQEQCNIGSDCPSCCCIQLETGGNACVDTVYCGQDASCTGSCASPGSACYGDYDCCNGGRCLLNAGNWYSCFKPCTYATDCGSGCCNYNSTIGTSICEAC